MVLALILVTLTALNTLGLKQDSVLPSLPP
jgi:hypothetical protein